MAFRIVSSDIYLPEYPWIAEDFDVYLGLSKGTSKKKFAVEKRYIASGQESAIFMATQAILKCLKQSPYSLSDIDLLIYASGTHHQSLPYDAAAVLAELKAPPSITSLDINSTCLSFLSALDYAQCVFAAKRHQRVLVVTSELGSGITLNKFKKPKPEVATLFSDGAAAYLLEASELSYGLHGALFETHHEGYECCQIKGGGSHVNPHKVSHSEYLAACQFEMDGKSLFRHIVNVMPEFLKRGIANAGLTQSDIAYFLPHQASHHGMAKLPKLTGFSAEKIVNNFRELGNQVAASLPINLHLLRLEKAGSGEKVLLAGSAAGLSLGMGVIEL
ncbi:3-oxoacyl-ACP synthase III family protein [Vibrio nigripulchritudo]|uniref:3-oxoacyl-ACP synthase III family protein n=1 Tax=Vibrio nigripulchritudo TaxID=28173 RepID=UPI0024917890|nr:ketoacyl-ACP synthase III [Vibrio nigripulchritudo]BDU38196.1 3-oxoacyl-ACP synthase [Vibrio nigripulchritudo]BDU43919.1 3-oxoacyl-ACP synthase [Vibrio nigripulchritudo]